MGGAAGGGAAGMSDTQMPWDQRLARMVVAPLADTAVHPNHLTVLSLLAGLAAGAVFATGSEHACDAAAALFMLAVFLDHTDGELARITGRTSRFGHHFDYLVGSAIYTALFIGLGLGLSRGPMGHEALALGLAAGLANPVIVALRLAMERRFGPEAVAHPARAGFEIEDFIYLIGPITWLGGVGYFFQVFGAGTLGYLLWTLGRFVWRLARGGGRVGE